MNVAPIPQLSHLSRIKKIKINVVNPPILFYATGMTDQEIQTIKRVATIYGFNVTEEAGVVTVEQKFRDSQFFWSSQEDFGDFFQEVAAYFYDKGYNSAVR